MADHLPDLHRSAARSVRCSVRRLALAVACALLAGSLLACSSPNRGLWRGGFDGSVTGEVEFRINTRGTELSGSMVGATRDGQPFRAEMEGKIRDEYFYATFRGNARDGLRPIPFEGFLKGRITAGEAAGDWEATPAGGAYGKLAGRWQVDQVAEESAGGE